MSRENEYTTGHRKEDRRTQYTKMVLSQSLLSLMHDKEIRKITVTEICRKADVNRNTFYKYYYGPEDLLATIEDGLLEIITTSLSQIDDLDRTGRSLLLILKENKDLSRVMLSENGNQDFLKKILQMTRSSFLEEWKLQVHSEKQGMIENMYTFGVGGMIALIRKWVSDDFKDDIEDIVSYFKFTDSMIKEQIQKYSKAAGK